MKRTYDKVTLVSIRFNLNTGKNLSKKEPDALSDTASIFFHFVEAFGNKLKLRDIANIWMVEDRVQGIDSVTCGIFQIYFYDDLFNQDQSSRKRLDKIRIEILLEELFVLEEQETNEKIIKQYANISNVITQ